MNTTSNELQPLVVAEFSVYDPSPLGLVISWDNSSGPIIIRIEPGSPAARQSQLKPGLLLKEVNFQPCSDGEINDEDLEMLLLDRPLTLGFQKPQDSQATWPELHRVRQALKEVKQTEAVAAAALEKLRITKGAPPPRREIGYFEVHPERVPLSRYGTLALCPPHLRKTVSEPHLHKSLTGDTLRLPDLKSSRNLLHPKTNLPADVMSSIQQHQSALARHPALSGSPHSHTAFQHGQHGQHGHHGHHDHHGHHGHHDGARHPTVSGAPHSHLLDPNSSMASGPHGLGLLWHGCSLPCPPITPERIIQLDAVCGPADLSYEHLVEEGTLCPFADGEEKLTVCHEAKYPCHVANFEEAFKITEAYEKGFRGQKRETVYTFKYANFSPRMAPRRKVPELIIDITCDSCGLIILKKKASKRFYYCFKCKEKGRRYELCPQCHDRERHQGENRWFGPGLHPHYKYCSHKGLTLYKRIASAYTKSPGILRALCDHCGHVICERGDHDARLFVCTTCRDQFGLRFEICEACFMVLHQRGWSAF